MTWDWRWKIRSVQRLKLAFDRSNFHKLQRKSLSRMEDETLAYHSQPAVHIPHRRVIPLVILSYLLSQVHLNVSNNFTLRGKSTKNIQDVFYFCIQGISLLCLLFSSASCAERVKRKRRKKKALSPTWSNFLFHHQTNAFCVLSAFTLASFSEERIYHLSLHQNNGLVLVMTRGSARIHPHFHPRTLVISQASFVPWFNNSEDLIMQRYYFINTGCMDGNSQDDGNRENLKANRKSTLALTSRKEEE